MMDFQISIKLNKNFTIGSVLPRSAKEAIGKAAVNEIRVNFREGGRPEKWVKSERAKKQGGKTLEDNGDLVRATQYKVTAGGVQLSNNMSYASIHNYGGVIKHPGGTPYNFINKGGTTRLVFMKKDGDYPASTRFTKPHDIRIPKREFMVLPANFNETIASIILQYNDWINK